MIPTRTKFTPQRLLSGIALLAFSSLLISATHWYGNGFSGRGTSFYEVYHVDKYIHFLGYFVMAILTVRLLQAWNLWSYRAAAVAICILLCFAAVDEWTQRYVQRDSDLLDWLADAAGVFGGVFVARFHWGKSKHSPTPSILLKVFVGRRGQNSSV